MKRVHAGRNGWILTEVICNRRVSAKGKGETRQDGSVASCVIRTSVSNADKTGERVRGNGVDYKAIFVGSDEDGQD